MVKYADFQIALRSFEPEFERPDELEQQSAVKKSQVTVNPLPSDVSTKDVAHVRDVRGLAWRLTNVATGKPEHFFQEIRVVFSPSLSET
jgi:hypothetical protein